MASDSYTAELAEKIRKHVAAEGYSEIGLRLKWDEWQTIISSLTQLPGTKRESSDEWYEREKAAFISWWESEGQQKFSETPTLAAGAGWLARAEQAAPPYNSQDMPETPDAFLAQWDGKESSFNAYAWRLWKALRKEIAARRFPGLTNEVRTHGPNSGQVEKITRGLLEDAYELFADMPDLDTNEVGSDAWVWKEQTKTLLESRCPFPIGGDDGSQKDCNAKGHCGCVYGSPATNGRQT